MSRINTKPRLSKKEINLIRKLAVEGKSLNYISIKTGIKKTTVYYWFVKFVNKKTQKLKIDASDEFRVGEFVGAFAGDGNFSFRKRYYHYKIRFFTALYEEAYAIYLQNLILELFGKKASLNKRKSVIVTTVYGKPIIEFLRKYVTWIGKKTYSISLKSDLSEYSNDFLRGFVRGLFDTDGCVNKNKLQLIYGSVSRKLTDQVSEILEILVLSHSYSVLRGKGKRRDFNYIQMYGRDNIKKFSNIVGFGNSIKKAKLENLLRQ